jgi:hypothetical protein
MRILPARILYSPFPPSAAGRVNFPFLSDELSGGLPVPLGSGASTIFVHLPKSSCVSQSPQDISREAPSTALHLTPTACLGPPRARAPVHNLLRAQRRPVRTSLARQLHPACGARALGSRARRPTRGVFMRARAIISPLHWGRAPQFQARTRAREPPVGWSQCMAQSALSPRVWPGPRTRRGAAGHA